MRFLLVLVILASASVAAEPVVVRDVHYGDTPADVASAHALDVYTPADRSAGPTPVMVYVDASDRSHREINERIGDPTDDRVTGRIEVFLDGVLTRSQAPTGKAAAPRTGGDRDAD